MGWQSSVSESKAVSSLCLEGTEPVMFGVQDWISCSLTCWKNWKGHSANGFGLFYYKKTKTPKKSFAPCRKLKAVTTAQWARAAGAPNGCGRQLFSSHLFIFMEVVLFLFLKNGVN